MKHIFSLFSIIILVFQSVIAQVPNEQDCLGAIPICQSTYTQNNSYSGQGNYYNEIPDYPGALSDDNCPNNCLLDGELNDVWYIFTVQTSGNLNFSITPNSSSDDYDWALYNLTNNSCGDILTNNSTVQASCNFCGTGGATGISASGSGNCQPGNTCSNFNSSLPVTAGETYVLNISNFSSTQSGYILDFTASTASIFDNIPPVFQSVNTPINCGATSITFTFSENVKCSTVSTGDFTISGPGGPYTVTAVSGAACIIGSPMENTYTITITPAISSGGTYQICLTNTAGSVADNCDNLAAPACFNFDVIGVTSTITSVDANCGANGSATINPSGGSGNYTYNWSTTPAQTGQTATGLPAGTYTVTVTDGACSGTNTVTINNTGSVSIATSVIDANCGPNGSATANPSGGTGSYTYNWSTTPAQTTPNATGLPAGTYTVTVTSGTCTQTTTVNVVDNGSVSVSLSGTDDNCNSSIGSVSSNPTGGTGSYTYNWSTTPPQTTQDINNLPSGTYTVTVTSGTCTQTASYTVNNIGGPTITISVDDETCDMTNGAIYITASGGSGTYTYIWDNGATTSDISNLSAGTYSVTVSDGGPCPIDSTITVNYISGPTLSLVSVTPEDIGMTNGAATVSAVGGTPVYSYNWTPGNISGETISNMPSGWYQVIVTDLNGCTDTLDVFIPLVGGATLQLFSVDAHCDQADGYAWVNITNGIGSISYEWNTVPPQFTDTAFGLTPGTYTVTVTDDNGTYTQNVIVGNIPGPIASFMATPNPAYVNSDILFTDMTSSNSIYNCLWHFGDGTSGNGFSVQHSYNNPDEYQVWLIVTDEFGCVDSIYGLIIINDVFTAYIPNAFTPNNDGRNDYFNVYGQGISSDNFSMRIYDRWGKLVFATTNINQAWDGSINGKEKLAITDTYTYKITLFDATGIEHIYVGKITVFY